MSNQRNAADRVRPFLQAMEKSIVAARQRRLNDRPGVPAASGPAPTPVPSATTPAQTTSSGGSATPSHSTPPSEAPVGPDGRPRLRARPKRPSNAVPSYDQGGFTPPGN
jgi:hypothetical protein